MNQERMLRILLAPCFSEKTTMSPGLYVFKVMPDAIKSDIKRAVEYNFNVSVQSVRVLHVKGKSRRFQQTRGRTKSWKKAYVMLAPGSEIALGDNK